MKGGECQQRLYGLQHRFKQVGNVMKKQARSAFAVISAIALGAAAITGLRAQTKAPVYAVIDISEIADADSVGFLRGRGRSGRFRLNINAFGTI